MDDYKSITRQTYEEIAADYSERDARIIEETMAVKTALDRFISLLPPHAKALDIGCGGGRDSVYMFKNGVNIIGIDFSENMIRNAKEKTPDIEYVQMDFEDMRFDDETFDGTWANASLHHVPKERLTPVLDKIHGLLKPDGIFFSINKHGNFDGMRKNSKFGKNVVRHFSFYRPDELSEMIKAAGFSIEEISFHNNDEWIYILAKKN